MDIKLLDIDYLNEAYNIILDAKKLLSTMSLQWQQGYPYKETIKKDILDNNLFGYFEDEKLLGIIALVKGFNPDYETIEGSWGIPTNDNDLTVHRIAVKEGYHNKGIGYRMMEYAVKYAKENHLTSVKADTHQTNIAMQKLCLHTGFTYRGIIYLVRPEQDNSRFAYELVL